MRGKGVFFLISRPVPDLHCSTGSNMKSKIRQDSLHWDDFLVLV